MNAPHTPALDAAPHDVRQASPACACCVFESTLNADVARQLALVPHVVARTTHGVLVRTRYPARTDGTSAVTHDVVTYPAWASLHAHVTHRATVKGYNVDNDPHGTRALKSAWMTLRHKWTANGTITRPDAELAELIEKRQNTRSDSSLSATASTNSETSTRGEHVNATSQSSHASEVSTSRS